MTPFPPHYSHDDMWRKIIALLHDQLMAEDNPIREGFLENALLDAYTGAIARADAIAFVERLSRSIERFRGLL